MKTAKEQLLTEAIARFKEAFCNGDDVYNNYVTNFIKHEVKGKYIFNYLEDLIERVIEECVPESNEVEEVKVQEP